MTSGKTCCFSGYRPQKLPYLDDPDDERSQRLVAALRCAVEAAADQGYTTFISGFAKGVDLLAAAVVLELKGEGRPLSLVAALPFVNSAASRSDLLKQCDEVTCVCPQYSLHCFMERNRYMVERSQRLIAVFHGLKGGTANTVAYARKKHREIVLINPDTGQITPDPQQPSLFEQQ